MAEKSKHRSGGKTKRTNHLLSSPAKARSLMLVMRLCSTLRELSTLRSLNTLAWMVVIWLCSSFSMSSSRRPVTRHNCLSTCVPPSHTLPSSCLHLSSHSVPNLLSGCHQTSYTFHAIFLFLFTLTWNKLSFFCLSLSLSTSFLSCSLFLPRHPTFHCL